MNRRRRISSRMLSTWVSGVLLIAIIVLSYGLDWRAALWADYHDEPDPGPPTSQHVEIWRVDR